MVFGLSLFYCTNMEVTKLNGLDSSQMKQIRECKVVVIGKNKFLSEAYAAELAVDLVEKLEVEGKIEKVSRATSRISLLTRLKANIEKQKISHASMTSWDRSSLEGFNSGLNAACKIIDTKLKYQRNKKKK